MDPFHTLIPPEEPEESTASEPAASTRRRDVLFVLRGTIAMAGAGALTGVAVGTLAALALGRTHRTESAPEEVQDEHRAEEVAPAPTRAERAVPRVEPWTDAPASASSRAAASPPERPIRAGRSTRPPRRPPPDPKTLDRLRTQADRFRWAVAGAPEGEGIVDEDGGAAAAVAEEGAAEAETTDAATTDAEATPPAEDAVAELPPIAAPAEHEGTYAVHHPVEPRELGAVQLFALGDAPQIEEAGAVQVSAMGGLTDALEADGDVLLEVGVLPWLSAGVAAALGTGGAIPGFELAVAPVLAERWTVSVGLGAELPVFGHPWTFEGSLRALSVVGPLELGASVGLEVEREEGAFVPPVPLVRLTAAGPNGGWIPVAEVAVHLEDGEPDWAAAVGLAVDPVHGVQIAGYGTWRYGVPGLAIALTAEGTPFR